jgi:hypothetical protein
MGRNFDISLSVGTSCFVRTRLFLKFVSPGNRSSYCKNDLIRGVGVVGEFSLLCFRMELGIMRGYNFMLWV